MTNQAKHLVESATLAAAGNSAVWLANVINPWVSLILGVVSIVWVSLQAIKFVQTWRRENKRREMEVSPNPGD